MKLLSWTAKSAAVVTAACAVGALGVTAPAYADTHTPFGKGNCSGTLDGSRASDQSGAWEQLTVSAGCNANENALQQIMMELSYYGVTNSGNRVDFVGATTGNHRVYGAKGAHSMVGQAGAPVNGFAQYCASAVVSYLGLSGDPEGGGAAMTQESGVVCWS